MPAKRVPTNTWHTGLRERREYVGLIRFHTEKEEAIRTDTQNNWHEFSLLLGVHFLKATAVGQIH
jgi:hypothetical protein